MRCGVRRRDGVGAGDAAAGRGTGRDGGNRPKAAAPGAPSRALVDTYCVGCHNARAKVGGLALDAVDPSQPAEHAEVWEKAIRKLRGGLMPPPGSKRPAAADVEAFVASLERALDAAADAHPDPGRVPLHRLNRAEYANAIEDLLGVQVDAAALLPKDDEADGFDNVASVLTVSPSFLDQYISAARAVTLRALGAPAPRPGSTSYRPAADQSVRVEGLPLGTRGGLLVDHVFPADGDYTLHIGGLAIAGYVRGMEYRHTLIVTIDGKKVFENQLGGEDDLRAIDQQQASAVAAINGRFQNIPLPVDRRPAQSRRGVRRPDLCRVGRCAARLPARRRRGPRAAHRQRRDSRAVHADRHERDPEPSPRARLPAGGRGGRDARAPPGSCRRWRAVPSGGP